MYNIQWSWYNIIMYIHVYIHVSDCRVYIRTCISVLELHVECPPSKHVRIHTCASSPIYPSCSSVALCALVCYSRSPVRSQGKRPYLASTQLGVKRSHLLQKMTELKQSTRSLRSLLKAQRTQECALAYKQDLALHTQVHVYTLIQNRCRTA